MNLVDLAGSEGVSKTKSDGIRFREGSSINKSLLALSNVIHRLSSASGKGGKAFINYRDSKLTRILQPALGGNSKTAIICTLSQLFSNYQESINTLHFGTKAKDIKTTVKVNEHVKDAFCPYKEIQFLKARIQELLAQQQFPHNSGQQQAVLDDEQISPVRTKEEISGNEFTAKQTHDKFTKLQSPAV